MHKHKFYLAILACTVLVSACAQENNKKNIDFQIKKVKVTHHADLAVTVWQMTLAGTAGKTVPPAKGQLDGAPVLGYVFPTSLGASDVGFGTTEGIVALALTSHPDFDDTPLWDENSDQDYDNDGLVWHPHWVVLIKDERVSGGFSVKQFKQGDDSVVLPKTNPGMSMYMDSPGFGVRTSKQTIQVVVPDYRINHKTDFNYDGVTAFMKVNTSDDTLPLLGVYEVYGVASGDLSLPYRVE